MTAIQKAEPANNAVLSGRVLSAAVFSHCVGTMAFYQLTLGVKRLSGIIDTLPLIVPETLSPQGLAEGDDINVRGQLRSYRFYDGSRNRLCLILSGELIREPIARRTPLGRDICDILVSVPRSYAKRDVIPVIAWGANSGACASLARGQRVLIKGRFQSRQYKKKEEDGEIYDRTALELSATEITPLYESGEAM